MDIVSILGFLLDQIMLVVFLLVVIAIVWTIWRKQNQPAAFKARAKARGWLGRAWDRFVDFWSR